MKSTRTRPDGPPPGETVEPTMSAGTEAIDQRMVMSVAHPLRIKILEELSDHVASPNWLAEKLEAGLTGVAYHTRALDRLGALELVDTAQRRGAIEHFYKATPRAFVGDPQWRKVPPSLLGGVSAATLQTFLDKAIAALESGTLDGREDTVFRWMPLTLDEEGWKEVVAIIEEATSLMLAAHLRSQDRLHESGGRNAVSAVVGQAAFETAGSLETA
ncbi:MAG TPA: winged helix-turn-helix domain-containing protein [Solirubrobacterales bacterium]|nr:winged helix-turn-helix domain-containing protein [Solirubrobacterales bacterium]